MTATIDRLRGAFSEVQKVHDNGEYAASCAIGLWTDDPKVPGVIAVVFQGSLYALIVPDDYRKRIPKPELEDLVNSVVMNAFIEWDEDRKRLLAAKSRAA